jgi:GNAT superfamily N-acetyltransferase
MNTALTMQFAERADVGLLAEWNHQLIEDEGHSNPMSLAELAQRMRVWLQTDYRGVIFWEGEPVAYALYRKTDGQVHLRQFFVRRDRRRQGIGRRAIALLRHDVWPKDVRLTVDVLCSNLPAVAFWRSVGYRDYSLTLDMPAGSG